MYDPFKRLEERWATQNADMPPCPECGIEKWCEVGDLYAGGTQRCRIRHRIECEHQADARFKEHQRQEEEAAIRQAWSAAHSTFSEWPTPSAYRGLKLSAIDGRPSSADGKLAAERYLASWPERKAEGQGLIFSGDIGTGKTMIMSALITGLVGERFAHVMFLTVSDLQNKLRDFDTAKHFLQKVKGVEVLALDDFGQERVTEWAASQLFDIIDTRTQAKRPTLFTTNLGARALTDHYVRCLTHGKDQMTPDQAKVTVDRILSRIRQRNATVVFTGKDQRVPDHSWLTGGAA